MYRCVLIILFFLFSAYTVKAQCFASPGNPVSGTENMGVMDKNVFRIQAYYRFTYSGKYFSGYRLYTGNSGTLRKAYFNYAGWLLAYGINKHLTIETEGGYFFNKTQVYQYNNEKLNGYGLSNAVVSLKPRIYYHPDKRFELSCALGASIPFSRKMQMIDGVTLPIDIQPSTGSFGLVFQTFIIKENSFKAMRFLFFNRIEKYFKNQQDFLFGNQYSTSFIFSKHFVREKWKLKDWTLIIQLKNITRDRNKRNGQIVKASGSCLFLLGPQLNLSLNEVWNISLMADIPFFQYYNDIQLANNYSLAFSIIRDISFKKNKNKQ